jgi:hypothetical protein
LQGVELGSYMVRHHLIATSPYALRSNFLVKIVVFLPQS